MDWKAIGKQEVKVTGRSFEGIERSPNLETCWVKVNFQQKGKTKVDRRKRFTRNGASTKTVFKDSRRNSTRTITPPSVKVREVYIYKRTQMRYKGKTRLFVRTTGTTSTLLDQYLQEYSEWKLRFKLYCIGSKGQNVTIFLSKLIIATTNITVPWMYMRMGNTKSLGLVSRYMSSRFVSVSIVLLFATCARDRSKYLQRD